jgi:hypothetical protein
LVERRAPIAPSAGMVHFFGEMSVAPDPAELAPSRDPAAYGRRRLFTGGFFVWVLLCLVCLAIGGVAGRFVFPAEPAVRSEAAPESAPRLAPPMAAPPPSGPASAPAASAPAASALPDTALADRVARLESAASRQNQAAAETLAAASLSVAAQGGAPFDRDLAAYESLAPGDADLRALAPLAARGAPSRATLAATLPDFEAAAVVAVREPARDAGFLAKLWAMFGKVVIVRNVDPAGPGVDGLLARAQGQASAGDLEGAVQTLQRLPLAARAPLADWLTAAGRRLEIDQHIAALRARALAALAPAPPSAPPQSSSLPDGSR